MKAPSNTSGRHNNRELQDTLLTLLMLLTLPKVRGEKRCQSESVQEQQAERLLQLQRRSSQANLHL